MSGAPEDPPASAPTNATCPGCRAQFYCGMVGGSERCWCMSMQPLLVPRSGKGCYCKTCLTLLTTPGTDTS